MIKVLFVCHGNICRSPMAEFLFKDYISKKNLGDMFYIESKATSTEEIGNPVHSGTKRILNSLGIDCSKKRARQIQKSDDTFDYILGMDHYNVDNLNRFFGGKKKIYSLLEFAGLSRDIRDPWYTGNFKETYEDIKMGIEAFFRYLCINHHLLDYS